MGVSAWLFLLFGLDLVALLAARFEFIQTIPDLWVSLLMLNPLDAFRIQALFALEQIPAEAANKTLSPAGGPLMPVNGLLGSPCHGRARF